MHTLDLPFSLSSKNLIFSTGPNCEASVSSSTSVVHLLPLSAHGRSAQRKPARAKSGQRCTPPWEARMVLATPRARLHAAPQEVAARTRRDDAARTSSACVAHAVARQVIRAVQPALLARVRTRLLRIRFRRETRERAHRRARGTRLVAVAPSGRSSCWLIRHLVCASRERQSRSQGAQPQARKACRQAPSGTARRPPPPHPIARRL